jgi:hypothetical protein
MKSLPIHLNRLDKALRAQGVVFKRHQLLESCAAAFGFHNSNEATAAAKKGALNPPAASAKGRIELGDGQNLILLLDPVANAPFAVDESFLEQQDAGTGNLFGVSPYGHLLDLTRSVTAELQTLANTLGSVDSGREFEFKIHTASIDHKHGTATFSSPTKEGVEAEVEAWCVQYWEEVAHRFPEGHKLEGAELIAAYFEAHEQEFVSYGETSIYFTASDILAAVGQAPQRDRPAFHPPVPVSAIADAVDTWADHPVYGSEDWRYEVGNGDTRQSYAEWVASKIEQDEDGSDDVDQPDAAQPIVAGRDGIEKRIYLTNGCCEPIGGNEALFEELGLRWSKDDSGEFDPLTRTENRYIAEEGPSLPNGYWPNMAYSFLYQGRKFAGAVMEVYFGDPNGAAGKSKGRDDTLAEVRDYVKHIEGRISGVGGFVFVVEDDGPDGDRHTIEVLVPFDHVIKHAEDFDDWQCQLARLLLPADGPRVIARFHGGVIQGDRWLNVVPPGDPTWDVTAEIISVHEMTALAITDDDFTSENFALAKSAPEWIRNWKGPFRIELQEQIRAYFEQIKSR